MRHAEKTGEKGDPDLSPKGYERANRLLYLFSRDERFRGEIDALYAAYPRKEGKSLRSVQTLQPLSNALGLSIRDANAFALPEDFAAFLLRSEALDGERIVVALAHDEIAAFVHALGAQSAPEKWPSGAYDRIWRVRFGEKLARFADLPMRLFPSDSQN